MCIKNINNIKFDLKCMAAEAYCEQMFTCIMIEF